MAISKKRKRKLDFRGETYFWYVKEDDDSLDKILRIYNEKRTIYLTYRVDQISDYFISPKIEVVKSNILQQGTYHIFPPLSDEFISKHNVSAILTWYHNQTADLQPMKIETGNPFENIDFKNGIVKHIDTDFSNLREDMLQVIYPHNILLYVGWYGTSNGFIVHLIKDEDWEKPLHKIHTGYYSLKETIESIINYIAENNI